VKAGLAHPGKRGKASVIGDQRVRPGSLERLTGTFSWAPVSGAVVLVE
jgi:hypothetical protein